MSEKIQVEAGEYDVAKALNSVGGVGGAMLGILLLREREAKKSSDSALKDVKTPELPLHCLQSLCKLHLHFLQSVCKFHLHFLQPVVQMQNSVAKKFFMLRFCTSMLPPLIQVKAKLKETQDVMVAQRDQLEGTLLAGMYLPLLSKSICNVSIHVPSSLSKKNCNCALL
jgi:hypothetical protein